MQDRDNSLDALQGWLLLLPVLALALPSPWSPFSGAPDTISIGVGVTALGLAPAMALSSVRAFLHKEDEALAAAIPLGAPLLLAPLGLAAVHLEDATDTFNAWRALVGLCAAAAAFMAASTLRRPGRRVLLRGLPVVTLLLLAGVFLEPGGAGPTGWAGAIGNTGDLSEAALPGAVLGAGLFLTSGGPFAVVGLTALLAYGLYVGLVPVYAGALALGVAFMAAFAASFLGRGGGGSGRRGAARRARILLVTLLLAVAGAFVRQALSSNGAGAEGPVPGETASEVDETTGGIAFRRLTWMAAALDTLPATGLDGAGPGQFQAVYPRFRPQEEVELSSRGRREPTPQEVEHAHSDPLTALVEYGYLGGGALVLLLMLVAARAAGSIAGDERARRDFGAAALAVVAVSLVNAPLLYAPLAHVVAFAVFGVVATPPLDGPRPHGKAGFAAQALVLLALLLVAPKALDLVRYGRAMAAMGTAVDDDDPEGRVRLEASRLAPILDRALGFAPDAPMALEKRAELLRASGAPVGEQLAAHDALLARRPDSVAALINTGSVLGAAGAYNAAAERMARAHVLDPGNPELLRNRARVAFDLRDAAAFAAALDELDARVPLGAAENEEYLRRYANEALVGCRPDLARVALARYRLRRGQSEVDPEDLNALDAAARAARESGDETMGIAYRTMFNHVVALDHLKGGAPGTAVTMARQAYQRAAAAGVDTGAARLRLAAAQAAQGDVAAAEALLGEAPLRRADGAALAPEERAALREAGLLGGASAGSH